MPELFGTCSWPGMTDFDSCSYTCAHGTQPGIATLVVSESQVPTIQPYGDLTFSDSVRTVTLRGCKVVSAQALNQGGRKVVLQIADGRWRWAYGGINGRYNVRDEHGIFLIETEMNFIELCKILLNDMGVSDREIIPTGPKERIDYPYIDWDRANPAAALEELVSHFGGAVCYQPVAGRVLIATLGKGQSLPSQDYIDTSTTFDFPQTPKHIRIVGSEVVVQLALALEAVGQEPGGEIKPIGELSYKPTNGWGRCVPPYFQNLNISDRVPPALKWWIPGLEISQLSTAEYLELAKKCIYRWYRVVLRGPDGGKLPAIPRVGLDPFRGGDAKDLVALTSPRQILPQEGVWRIGVNDDEEPMLMPARVYGVAHRGAINAWSNTAADEFHNVGFTIDSEKGLVMFDRYMYRINPTANAVASLIGGGQISDPVDSYQIAPAELVLIASCMFRETKHGQVLRYFYDFNTGSPLLSAPLIKRYPNIREIIEQEYDPTTWQVKTRRTNRDVCDREAKHYARQEMESFKTTNGGERSYTGILPIDPDGYIRQVTWSVGGGRAPTTHIAYNCEPHPWIESYAERKKQQKIKAFINNIPLPLADNIPNRIADLAGREGGGR